MNTLPTETRQAVSIPSIGYPSFLPFVVVDLVFTVTIVSIPSIGYPSFLLTKEVYELQIEPCVNSLYRVSFISTDTGENPSDKGVGVSIPLSGILHFYNAGTLRQIWCRSVNSLYRVSIISTSVLIIVLELAIPCVNSLYRYPSFLRTF